MGLKVDDVILVQVDDKRKHSWPLGRNMALHHIRDGRILTVPVKFHGSVVRRSIKRLYLLMSCVCDYRSEKEVKTVMPVRNISQGT